MPSESVVAERAAGRPGCDFSRPSGGYPAVQGGGIMMRNGSYKGPGRRTGSGAGLASGLADDFQVTFSESMGHVLVMPGPSYYYSAEKKLKGQAIFCAGIGPGRINSGGDPTDCTCSFLFFWSTFPDVVRKASSIWQSTAGAHSANLTLRGRGCDRGNASVAAPPVCG
jgi:hypothetical protein